MAVVTAPSNVLPGAEPFHFAATGDVACLLVHGFTGTPNEVRDLGRHLAERGVTSRGVLLSGHGTSPEQMAHATYRDWISEVESALDDLLASGKRVFVGGLSMGGTLALNVAARRRDDPRLAGVFALSAPVRLVDWRLSLLPIAGWLVRWQTWGRPDIKDQRQWERHVAYPRFHLRALVEFLRLLRNTRQALPNVSQPLLLVQSRLDNTVPPFNADLIFNAVSSPDRQLVWLDNCYHVVTLDHDSERVFHEVSRFIEERTS